MEAPVPSGSRSVEQAAARLSMLLVQVPSALQRIPAPGRRPPGCTGTWSYAETLGHLIDSALNNIQRFVRLQHAQQLAFPVYDPDQWVAAQAHAQRPWPDLISEWSVLNSRVLHLMEHTDAQALEHVWSEGGPATLRFLMVDYLTHLDGHLADLLPGSGTGPAPTPG